MKKFEVKYTTQSVEDMDSVSRYVTDECQAPLTAKRYMEGIKKEADQLKVSAGVIAVDEELSRQMGIEVKRTHYKNVSIIFSVEGNIAYVHRIIPQKMVIYPIIANK